MEPALAFLLDVWRAVGRHVQLEEATAQAAPALARHCRVERLLVRGLDPAHLRVETLAESSPRRGGTTAPVRSECTASEMERLLAWCRQETPLHHQASSLPQRLPGLLPRGLQGDVLAGPLRPRQGQPAVLLVIAAAPDPFAGDSGWLPGLLEPFTVALENDRRLRELTALREAVEADKRSLLSRLERHDIADSIVGAETGLRPVLQQVDLVAGSDVPVLILGETGSGKEVLARAIHTRSPRSAGPFLRVNCGAIPSELIDSELFGHEPGSFTGAVSLRTGWFERADGGTLFLDECGELPLAAQVRLLRILQDGTFQRVGGEQQLHVNVRIVAATHRPLRAMVAEGRFREDLWYRLAVFPIQLPALRERVEDIPALTTHFALRAARRLGAPPLVPAPEDLALLAAYPWPGNVRELAAVIERAAILGNGKRLEVRQALGAPLLSPASPAAVVSWAPGRQAAEILTLDQAMVRHIELALTRTRGKVEGGEGTAALLGINPHTLRARMRKLGIDWQHFRGRPRSEAA